MSNPLAGRPRFSFVLIDLPSDHEIDYHISTECEIIQAILHNRKLGTRLKWVRATSLNNLSHRAKPYQAAGFVHLATHGDPDGIGLIGGDALWPDVAKILKRFAPTLVGSAQRVLCLSCCYSKDGYSALAKPLRGHFTGIYYFGDLEIGFADAITVWSMFYRKKTIEKPAAKVKQTINDFFGRDILQYRSVPSKRARRIR
ncbi:MAG: hypothetical protein ACYCX6_03100 [Vulcanimicrobiaceae bacterium]